MRYIFVIPLLSIFFLLNCSKEESKSKLDNNLLGKWRIDSICGKSGSICTFSSIDTWNKSNKNIILEFNDTFGISSVGYHYSFMGDYFIFNVDEKRIKLTLTDGYDRLNRPISKWQPFCIENLNLVNSYRIKEKNLEFYAPEKTIFLTKQ